MGWQGLDEDVFKENVNIVSIFHKLKKYYVYKHKPCHNCVHEGGEGFINTLHRIHATVLKMILTEKLFLIYREHDQNSKEPCQTEAGLFENTKDEIGLCDNFRNM